MRRPSPRFGKHCLEHHWTMVSCERFIFLGFRTSLYRPINRLMESQPTTFLKNEYIIISRSMEFSRLEKDFSHIHLLFILMTTFGWAQQNLSCLRVGLCRKSSEIDGDSGRASNSSRPRRDPLKSDERKPKSQRQFSSLVLGDSHLPIGELSLVIVGKSISRIRKYHWPKIMRKRWSTAGGNFTNASIIAD